MSKNVLFRIGVISIFFVCCSCINAFAESGTELSFSPSHGCRKPPKSPPNKFLYKHYEIYTTFGAWKIFDINGDGWCDWVRGGHEGYITDIDSPPMRDFIYLGTPNGWRYFDQAKLDEKSKAAIGGDNAQSILSKHHNALNFYQPIAIYRKGSAKPYIATVIRYDAASPPPNLEQIEIYQWSEQLDKLLKVHEDERNLIIDFLQSQLCKNPPAVMDGEGQFILAMGDLCFPRK
jgi:hypothetical protein